MTALFDMAKFTFVLGKYIIKMVKNFLGYEKNLKR